MRMRSQRAAIASTQVSDLRGNIDRPSSFLRVVVEECARAPFVITPDLSEPVLQRKTTEIGNLGKEVSSASGSSSGR